MDRSAPVRDVMSTEVLTLAATDGVEDAMRRLLDSPLHAAPVVDDSGQLVGMLSDADLILQETRLQFPTLISILGASIEIKPRHFDEDLQKALGATVGEVMSTDVVTCTEDDTVEQAATLMHDHDVAQVPVVRGGRVVGVVSRKDVLRAILA